MSETPIRPLVLVVDDERSVVEALSSLLAPRLEPLFRVEGAASAEEAIEVVSAGGGAPVALVISDEKMPGKQGTDLLIALRQRPEHRDGGRILVTGYAGLASAQKAINEAEVDRYYPKPWDADGQLLPAVREILTRFAEKRGLDRYLVAVEAAGSWERTLVGDARRAWWEYLNLLGEPTPGEATDEANPLDPLDDGATIFLAYRAAYRGKSPAGTLRLRRGEEGWILDGLAFQPEEAGDEVETLLLRVALLHAAAKGIDPVATDAPLLRRDVYEPVGFRPADGAPGATPGTLRMQVRPAEAVAAWTSFAARFAAEHRLCTCAQTTCPDRDYAAKRRGYWCPLDVAEGRTPEGFPGPVKR
jgi:two-component system chemotaxis response regulator CheY